MSDVSSEFSKPVLGLRRSKSESAKTLKRISVMERIERFEQHARRSSTSSPKSVGRQAVPTIFEKSPTPSPPVKVVSKSHEDVNVGGQRFYNGRSSITNEIPGYKSPPSSPKQAKVNEQDTKKPVHQVCSAAIIPSLRIPLSWSWTELGGTVNADLRDALELEFFSSPLLTSGCFATFDGEILGISRGCRVMKKEIQTVVSGMMKREYITSSRIVLGGTIYSCLSATGHVIRARAGKLGTNTTTFKKTVLICFYTHPILPKPIGKLVQDMEKVLSNFGY